MTLGIIGTGRMATQRATRLLGLPDHEIRWVCSRKIDRGNAFLEEIGDESSRWYTKKIAVFDDLAKALESTPVDAVIDTSPNAAHPANAEAIFSAGCHLFVEYPHATSVADGRRLLDLAHAAARSLHVGLTHRFSEASSFLRRLLRGESARLIDVDLGPARSFSETICSGNPISRWFDSDDLSGGMFVASMYHYLDQLTWFFGRPSTARGAYDAARDSSDLILHDTGHALLWFRETIVSLAYSRGFVKPGLGSRLLVVCENGYLEQAAGKTIVRWPDGEREIQLPENDAVGAELDYFIGHIEKENETPAWAQQALELAVRLQEDAGSEC